MYKQNHTTKGGFKVGDLKQQAEIQAKCLQLHETIETVFHEMRTAPRWSAALLERVEHELIAAVSLIRSEHPEEEADPTLTSKQPGL